MNQRRALYLLPAMACLAMAVCVALGDPKTTVPPEVLKQFDPDVLSGKRPTIITLTQKDIFGLRDKPDLKADVVHFDFEPGDLTKVQKDVLRQWLQAGHNRVWLRGEDTHKYSDLLDIKTRQFATGALTSCKCEVTTDVGDVGFEGGASAVTQATGLTCAAKMVLNEKIDYAVAGMFKYGQAKIFFSPKDFTGPDAERFTLNFRQWMLGLKVPSEASTAAGPGSETPTTLAVDERLDSMTPRDGDPVSGVVLEKEFTIKTPYAELTFGPDAIDKIVFEGAGENLDSLKLKTGDVLNGIVKNRTISIKPASKPQAQFTKDKLREIVFRASHSKAPATGSASEPASTSEPAPASE